MPRMVTFLIGAAVGGRISICYARKGFKVSILDFNAEYLNRACHRFQTEGLKVNTILADCRETPCLFNSVGFLNDTEQSYAFASLYKSMKSKGRVIVDAMNLFFLAPFINQPYENKNDEGWVFRQNNNFDFMTNTMYSLFEILNEQGQVLESKPFYQRLYTPMDLMKIMEKAGFTVTEVYGGFKGEKVNFDSPKIVIVGEKA